MLVGAWSEKESAWGGRRSCGWEWLTRGARVAAAAGEADGCAGVSACWAGSWATCVRAGCKAGAVGLAGPHSRAGLAATRLPSSFSFSILFFFFFVLNSNFVLEFEFRSGGVFVVQKWE